LRGLQSYKNLAVKHWKSYELLLAEIIGGGCRKARWNRVGEMSIFKAFRILFIDRRRSAPGKDVSVLALDVRL